MVTVLAPTDIGIAPLAVPLATAVPFTVIVASALLAVGVNFMVLLAKGTFTEYVTVAGANTGFKVPVPEPGCLMLHQRI